MRGPGSSVGIATELRAGRSGVRIPVGARFSALVQTGPGAHPPSCTMGTGSFPEVKSGQGVTQTPHPVLVPWSWKSRAIPLLPLWAVRPVQSLSACTRAHFTFTYIILNSSKCSPDRPTRVSPELHHSYSLFFGVVCRLALWTGLHRQRTEKDVYA